MSRLRAVPKLFSPAAALLIAAICCAPVAAQDTVYVSSSRSTRGYTKLSGRVVDYTGRELRVVIPGTGEQSFPAGEVLRIETQHVRQQVEADAAFAKGEFDSALALYREARTAESRTWVRRQITAAMVWCYRALGRPELAAEEFLLLIRSDPQTLHFECIPLAWVPSQPSVVLEQSARQWLTRQEMPAAVLLGASHLMSTALRPTALARLRQLTADPDRRIAQLARAQTWRAAVVTADGEELAGWQRAIEEMPQPLRAGPYYVLGLARAQRQDWEQAALAFLRVPILYPQHRSIAARSLIDAGQSLEKTGGTGQAARLYRELIATYPETRSATEARNRLEELAAQGA